MMEKVHGQMNREWNGTKLQNSRREKADYETAKIRQTEQNMQLIIQKMKKENQSEI